MRGTKNDLQREILRGAIPAHASVEDRVWIAWVLHTHAVQTTPGLVALTDAGPAEGGQWTIYPTTRRGAAELLASLYAPTRERGSDLWWTIELQARAHYSFVEELPAHLRPRFEAARRAVAAHPLVAALIED